MKIGKKLKHVLMIGAVAAQLLTAAPAPAAPQRPFVTCGFSWGSYYICLPIVIGGTGEG